MDVLWAPWRMEYVASAVKPQGCVFCDSPAVAESERRQRLVLEVGGEAAVMLNRFPYSNGHLLVLPRRHARWPEELEPGERAGLDRALWKAAALVREVLRPDGLNVGMNLGRSAGAGIDAHLHWHVVPRWGGDVNFMPVIAETKVLPEHLMATYDKLRTAIEAGTG